MSSKIYNICEFFVGAGGSHLGFLKNGFNTIYVNDIDKDALNTFIYNNKEHLSNAIIDNSDITLINPKTLKKSINQEVDVCFGGIVCKGFSLAGERSPNDKRNFFYKYYLDIVKEIMPKISIIENVKGMLFSNIVNKEITPKHLLSEIDNLWKEIENYKGKKSDYRKKNIVSEEFENYGSNLRIRKKELENKIKPYLISVFDDIFNIYNSIGYKVYYKILNSAWYGSSTKRERLIIIAVRTDIKNDFKFPIPEFNDNTIQTKMDFDISLIKNIKFKPAVTIKNALEKIDYSNKNDIDNIPMNHSKKTVDRFKYIEQGKNIQDVIDTLPEELKVSKFYSRGSTMRLSMESLAPTLVPGHSNFPIHPLENRSITVREAATITGFPLDYKFFGSHSKRCEQVGNAVPPHLSNAIAKSVKQFLNKLQKNT